MRPIPLPAAAVEPCTHRPTPGLLRRVDPRLDGSRSDSQAVGAAEDELLIRLHLAHRTRRPRVLIDGHLWEEVRWIVTPNGDGWNAVAVLGLEHLPVGRHQVRIEPAGHPVTTVPFRHSLGEASRDV